MRKELARSPARQTSTLGTHVCRLGDEGWHEVEEKVYKGSDWLPYYRQ